MLISWDIHWVQLQYLCISLSKNEYQNTSHKMHCGHSFLWQRPQLPYSLDGLNLDTQAWHFSSGRHDIQLFAKHCEEDKTWLQFLIGLKTKEGFFSHQ
jgi:hypothetical protein